MPDKLLTKAQLLDEVRALRARVSQLETAAKQWSQTEAALRKSAEFLKQTQQITQVGGWEYDTATRQVVWTAEAYRIYEVGADYNPSDIHQAISFYAPEDQALLDRSFQRAVEQGVGYDLELKFAGALGTRKWVRTIGQAEIVAGEVTRVYGMVMDITIRKQAEEALRQSEENYRGLFENASIGIFHSLPAGRFLRVNPRLADMLGYASPEEMVSSITDIRTQIYLDSNRHANLLAVTQQRAGWVYAENRYRRKDGNILIAHLAVRQVLQPDGALAYLEGFVEDVTDRKQAEAAEREQRALAEALRDTAKSLTGTLNLEEVFDRVLLNVSRVIPHQAASIMLLDESQATAAVARYYGYQAAETDVYGQRFAVVQVRNLRTLFETGQPLVIEDVHQYEGWVSGPGREWICSYAGVPIRIQGNVIGFLNLYGAIPGFYSESQAGRLQSFADQAAIAILNAQLHTRLQRYADELEQRVAERTRELTLANERLLELDRLKDEFTARIGHELLTPLTNVKIYLELLATGKPERYPTYLKTLKREADRLQVLIEDLLRVRQLSVEGFEPEITRGDINQLIGKRLVGWGEQAARRGLELNILLAPDLPPALIDREYTAQAIGNVVNNAISYTPAGSITLSTATRSDEAGRWVTICVTDTGPGITPEDLPHIFERFYRGRAAADYKTPGIGVGLAISREIVTKLNGRLSVETTIGVGSTFAIWLPV